MCPVVTDLHASNPRTLPLVGGIDDVEALFGPDQIRVRLDWDLLRSSNATVTAEAIDAATDRRLSTPWYVDPARGREVPYDQTALPPLPHHRVADHLSWLDGERVARIDAIAATCTPGAETWVLPCYAAGTTLLVLDGNHRLAANTVHDLSARVLAVIIHGPLDPAVLPDLAAFMKGPAR